MRMFSFLTKTPLFSSNFVVYSCSPSERLNGILISMVCEVLPHIVAILFSSITYFQPFEIMVSPSKYFMFYPSSYIFQNCDQIGELEKVSLVP